MNVCQGFVYIGQSVGSCDRCGKPAWEHDFSEELAPGSALGSALLHPAWVNKPWSPEVIETWQRSGYITSQRAQHLKQVKGDGMRTTTVSEHCCACAKVCYHREPPTFCEVHQRRREHGDGKRMDIELPEPTQVAPQPTVVEWEWEGEEPQAKVTLSGDKVKITGLRLRAYASNTQYIPLAVLRSLLPALLAACHWQDNAND